MGTHDCSEMGSLGCPKQWVAPAVLLRPPGPFSGLGLLEMCSAWRNPIPCPSVPSVGWQSQSQCHLLQNWCQLHPLCRDTTHSPPAHRSLARVVSSGATTPIVTYSIPKAPLVQNGDPPAPDRHGTSTGAFTPNCVGMRGHPGICGARRDASDGHAGVMGGDVGRPPAPPQVEGARRGGAVAPLALIPKGHLLYI